VLAVTCRFTMMVAIVIIRDIGTGNLNISGDEVRILNTAQTGT
jgi:hypothetical protein